MNTDNMTASKPYGSGSLVGTTVAQPVTQTICQSGGVTVAPQSSVQSSINNSTMANTKEKTPMCLINELARFNKIMHRYRLTDETGPAHKKVFTVTLELGPDEKHEASGQSIKKAQHAAAEVALAKSCYRHPPPKMCRQHYRSSPGSSTPTVELNALAMKLGEPAVYQLIESPVTSETNNTGGVRSQQIHNQGASFISGGNRSCHLPPNFNFRGMYNQRYHHQSNNNQYGSGRYLSHVPPPNYCVSLNVGSQKFIGEGKTIQAARHSAAEKALMDIRDLTLPEYSHASKLLENGHGQIATQPVIANTESKNELLAANTDIKSPVSLVHEVALKRNLNVIFEVIGESGPAHMKTFVTQCCVGEIQTKGEGNGKRVSKKRAAELMLEELKKLPPLPSSNMQKNKSRTSVIKKKSRNLIKEQKASPEYGQGINPISRLIQIQQAKKEKDPIYKLLSEEGLPRKRIFLMEVTVGDLVSTGKGPNKKLAKRAAAESMLQLMGYSKAQRQPTKPAIKNTSGNGSNSTSSNNDNDRNRKVKFVDHNDGNKIGDDRKMNASSATGRQIAPGLLLMPSDSSGQPCSDIISTGSTLSSSSNNDSVQNIAKEILDQGISSSVDAMRMTTGSNPSSGRSGVSPKQHLLYLADVHGFNVIFTDFPKVSGNRSEFLSLVTLSTNPPEVSHGAGTTIEESHNRASAKALNDLAELGLDKVTPAVQYCNQDGSLSGCNDTMMHSTNHSSAGLRRHLDRSGNDMMNMGKK